MEPEQGERGSGLVLATMTLSYGLTLLAGPVVAGGTGYYLTHAAHLPEAVAPMVCLVFRVRVHGQAVLEPRRRTFGLSRGGRLAIANLLEFQHPGYGGDRPRASRQVSVVTHHRFADLVGRRTHLPIVGGPPLPALASSARRLPGRTTELPAWCDSDCGYSRVPFSQGMTIQSALWVLGATVPVAAVGAFSRAQSITVKIGDLNYRLAAVIYPSLVRRAHIDDGGKSFVADVVTSLGVRSSHCCSSSAGRGASHTIISLFGADFLSAADSLAILLIATGISTATMIFGEALTALNRPSLTSVGLVIGLVATLAPMIPLSRAGGATRASLAFLAGTVTSTVFLFAALVRSVPGEWVRHRMTMRSVALLRVAPSHMPYCTG